MITVTSADGTDTQVITVTITGTNDVPLITGDTKMARPQPAAR
jgi:VCBS repeat-containing protein